MAKIIKHKGKRQKRVTHKAVAELMGAERLAVKAKKKKAPMTLTALREFVRGELQSTGGRPSLEGAEKVRRKVCLFKGDLARLEKLADRISSDRRKVTPLQLVAALVHKELEALEE